MAELPPVEELVLKYIDNELSSEEKSAFEKRMASDPSIQKRVNGLMLTRDAVTHYGIRQSVASVRSSWELSKQKSASKAVPMRKWLRYGAVAASIILLVTVLTVYTGSPSADKLYNEVYVGYTLSNARGEQASPSALEQAYQQKDFSGVIRLAEKKPLSGKDQLLLGIAYLETNEITASIHMLKGLQEQANIPYHLDADFYLGLAYLKNKDYDDAIGVFQKIQLDTTHPYHHQVTDKLIEDIRSLKK